MKHTKSFIVLLFLIPLELLAQNSSYEWVKTLGGSNTDIIEDIVVGNNNTLLITGTFYQTIDLDPGVGVTSGTSVGLEDIYISKLSNNGDLLWTKQIGGSNTDRSYAIALDNSGNIYVSGSFTDTVDFDPGTGVYNLIGYQTQSSGFILKLDPNGDFVWAQQLTGNNFSSLYSIVVKNENEIYLSGGFSSTTQFSGDTSQTNFTAVGLQDALLMKLDSNGNTIWMSAIGSSSNDYITNILINNTNEVYFSGSFGSGTDLDLGNGTFILNSNNQGAAIVKLDTSDTFNKALLYNNVTVVDLKKDPFDNLIITGYYSGTEDFDPGTSNFSLTSANNSPDIFICKLNPQDNFLWAKQFSGIAPNYGNAVTTDSQGSIYITGEFSASVDFDPNVGTQNLTTTGGPDAFIAKLNAQGDFRWVNQIGSSSSSVTGTDILLDNNENLFTTGHFGGGSVDFDPGTGINNISSVGGLDAYIYKINTNQIVNISNVKAPLEASIFGNPTNRYVRVLTSENLTYRLTDIRGKILRVGTISPSSSQIELEGSLGIYLLQLNNSHSTKTFKLIKE